MKLIDDIDSFAPKATKILTLGLSPLCDHGGFNEGVFSCLDCSKPLFDKDDLILESSLIYSFRRPLSLLNFDYRFDAGYLYPRICIDCCDCKHPLGHIEFHKGSQEKIFHILSRAVILQPQSPV